MVFRKNIGRLCGVVTLSLAASDTLAQEQRDDLAMALDVAVVQVRQGEAGAVSADILSADSKRVLDLLRRYEGDRSANVRHFAYSLGWQIAQSDRNPDIRKTVTARLIHALTDSDPLVWQHASKNLLTFGREDFAGLSKAGLQQLLAQKNPRREVVRIAGVADLREELPRLKNLLIDEVAFQAREHSGRWYGTVGWAARLSRARMGVKEDIVRTIELIEAETDDVVRVTVLLSDLGYIGQPEAITVLGKYLQEEKRLPAYKRGTPGTKYAQYALDVLTDSVAEFPVGRKYVGGYTNEDIAVARSWVRKRGN